MSYAHRFYYTSCKVHVSASFLPSSLGSVSLFVIGQHDCQIDHFGFGFLKYMLLTKIPTLASFEGFRGKRAYIAFLADFHFLQDRANFWQTDLF